MLRNAVVVVAMLTSALASAQNDDAMARARSHFEAGRALYNLHQYTDAIREFSAGYQLANKPLFLVNLGQCYDKMAEGSRDVEQRRDSLQRAREMYAKYLQDAPPNDKMREQVPAIVEEIDRKLAALPPPAVRAREPAPPPTTPPVEHAPATVESQPAVSNNAVTTTPPEKKSFVKKHWWIFPVGAVVLAGAAVGIYFAVRPSSGVDCGSASLGCVPANQ